MVPRAPMWALLLVVVVVAAGAGAGPAVAADDGLVLTRAEVPGYRAAGTGAAQARLALGRAASPALRRARAAGAAFRSGGRRLTAGAFVLGSPKAAAAALRAAGRGGRRAAIGDGAIVRSRTGGRSTDVVVLVRAGSALGAVRVQARGRWRGAAGAAESYAATLATRLRRVAAITAWQRTLDGVGPDGAVSKATALRAFAIAYGPLPGARRPSGPLGVPASATLAMQLVARVWPSLSDAQRAAVDRALGAPHGPQAAPAARASAQVLTPDPGYQAKAETYANFYRSKLAGAPPVTVKVFTASEDITTGSGGKAWADALPVNAAGEWGAGEPAYCRVRVPPYGHAQAGKPFFELIMAHEVFHCFQFRLMANWRQRSAWIIEGMADWAATSAYLTTPAIGAGPYRLYLQTQAQQLFSRSYDASGFWGHADEVGGAGSLWAKVPAVLGAPDDPTSFALAGGTADAFVSTWASAPWRFAGAGAAWKQSIPYDVPAAIVPPAFSPITGGTTLGASPYAVQDFAVVGDPDRPLVNVLGLEGRLRAGASTKDFGVIDNQWFCFGSCKCPKGRVSSIPPNQKVPNKLLALALTGGATAGAGRVTYHSLDEFCQKKQPPPKAPPGPGETNGDPHLTSLDGLHFDFQAAGEFRLVRSRSGDLEIQARQQPYNTSRTVTVNTQLAMRAGGRRVTVSPGTGADDPTVVRIDGTVTPMPAGSVVTLGDASVAREPEGGYVDVTWPDGSNVVVRPVGSWGVAARIELAAGRRGAVTGLLGDFDGSPRNDLADRRGKRIAYTPAPSSGWGDRQRYLVEQEYEPRFFDALYDEVGDAWRLKQSESILDYGSGQSTRTFTDRSIPARPVDPEALARARRAAAERICRDRGVTQPGPLADCIVDVAATGNAAFADDAAAAQEAANVAWTRLAAGADRAAAVSLLEAGDGTLHVAWNDRAPGTAGRMVNVTIDRDGHEGPVEVIDTVDSEPQLLAAPDGSVLAQGAQLPEGRPSGIYQYARGAGGAWSRQGAVTTTGTSYASRPDALFTAAGTLLTVSPMVGGSRVFVGAAEGNPGIDPNPDKPDCYTTSPALARDGAAGVPWLAWVQWDCPETGVFVQQLDPATGRPVGAPLKAPGSTWTRSDGTQRYTDLSLSDRLAFTGRPGQPGVYLAFWADDGADLRLWRVGDPDALKIPRRKDDVRNVMLAAEPQGGRLWLGWTEGSRLWVQRTSAAAVPEGAPRPLDPPRSAKPPLLSFHNWDVAARAGALDVLYGYRPEDTTPGALWHARVLAGAGGALTARR